MSTAIKHPSQCRTAWKKNPCCPVCGTRHGEDRFSEIIKPREKTAPMCYKCKASKDKSDKRRRMDWEKQDRHNIRAFAKHLIELKEAGFDGHYTQMRIVTDKELAKLAEKHSLISGEKSSGRLLHYVFSNSSWGVRRVGTIYEAGHYRVEPINIDKPIEDTSLIDLAFFTSCSGGFPSSGSSSIEQSFFADRSKRRSAAERSLQYKRATEQSDKKTRDAEIKKIATASNSNSTKFFQALAMSGCTTNERHQ